MRIYDASTDKTLRCVPVPAGSSAQASQIPDGTYTLAFTTGLGWQVSGLTFRWHPSYKEFENPVQYSEQRVSEGQVQVDDISITLHSVVGGNVRTRAITREEFLKGHHHRG